ncbi:MAG: distal tail protein Dit [Mycoplasmoidaceae bacterium]
MVNIKKFYLIFNNRKNTDLNLDIIQRPNFPTLTKKYEVHQVTGRNGGLYEFLGYEDRTIEVEFNLLNKNSINNHIRIIRKWLDRIEDNKLAFSDDKQYFFKVKHIEYENIERELNILGKFKVTFICDSFSYDFNSQKETEIINNSIIFNYGDFKAKPILKFLGNGAVKLNINDSIINLNVGQEIILNSQLELCYRNNFEMQNSQMKGNFPILKLGNNSISWIGNITKAIIIPNFIFY